VLDPIAAEDLRRSLPWISTAVVTGRMISTIPLARGVDRRAWRARLGVDDRQLLLVSFGLIHPRRRLELIIDALAELNRDGAEAHLLFIGGEAEYDQEVAHEYALFLRGKVEELGLAGATDWLDHADARTVSESLQAADVAVLLYPGGASGRNTTLQAVMEHGVALTTTLGPATPDEMRRRPGITFLPEGDYSGHDVADAVRKSARRGAEETAAAREASRMPEHIEFHLDIYRRLLR
jgi:glycosyltransferase involved in cell wall biosynthesis